MGSVCRENGGTEVTVDQLQPLHVPGGSGREREREREREEGMEIGREERKIGLQAHVHWLSNKQDIHWFSGSLFHRLTGLLVYTLSSLW